MHQHSCFARAGAGKHQDIRLFSIVRNDSSLDWVFEALYDGLPRFRCGLTGKFLVSIWQPSTQEIFSAQAEIVHGQAQRIRP